VAVKTFQDSWETPVNDLWAKYWKLTKKHLAGPVGSVIFHLVVIVLLVKFAVGEGSKTGPEVEVQMMDPHADKIELEKEIPKPVEKIEQPVDPVNEERPDVATVNTIDIPSDQNEGTGVGDHDGVGIGSGDASLGQGFEVAMSKSPLVMKGLYANRTAGGRGGAIKRYGGSGRGEEAVLRALRWLKLHQDEDGSWQTAEAGADRPEPLSRVGLALLCFLAHGETPASPEFGKTVEKAMKYLAEKQDGSGRFGGGSGQEWAYVHGICTYAISESFGLTKIMALKDSMDKAVDFMIKGQQAQGGFNYGYSQGDRWDMSVSGWQCQALKAAKMAGSSNEKLEDAITNAIHFLKTQAYAAGGGGFCYAGTPGQPGNGAKWTMTGAGSLCMQLLGQPNAPEVKAGVESLKGLTCAWAEGGNQVYGWYYVTQAKFQAYAGRNPKEWAAWNNMFSKMLIGAEILETTTNNVKLGHWTGGEYSKGPVYTTTLCVLMLEVYYRYLPTYKQAEEAVVAAPEVVKPKSGDDVVVDVH